MNWFSLRVAINYFLHKIRKKKKEKNKLSLQGPRFSFFSVVILFLYCSHNLRTLSIYFSNIQETFIFTYVHMSFSFYLFLFLFSIALSMNCYFEENLIFYSWRTSIRNYNFWEKVKSMVIISEKKLYLVAEKNP